MSNPITSGPSETHEPTHSLDTTAERQGHVTPLTKKVGDIADAVLKGTPSPQQAGSIKLPLVEVKPGENKRIDIIAALAKVKAEDRESISTHAAPLLKGITGQLAIRAIIGALAKIKAEDRESVSKYVAPFLLGNTDPFNINITISPLIAALAKVKAEDRESVSTFAAPLLKRITDRLAIPTIIEALAKIKAEDRESVSKYVAPLLQGITDLFNTDITIPAIIQALAKVRAEDRESVSVCAAPLLKGIADQFNIHAIIEALAKMKAKDRESVSKYAAPLLLRITDSCDTYPLILSLYKVKAEDRKSVSECAAAYLRQRKESNKAPGIIRLLMKTIFIPPQYYETFFSCSLEYKGEGSPSPIETLLSQPKILSDFHAHMLARLKEDENMEPDNGLWLCDFAWNISADSAEWHVSANSDLSKKLSEIKNKYSPYTFDVDYELLKSNPEQILRYFPLKIGAGIFPKIQFLDENQRPSEGFDAGGLKRQLQGTLFEHLFNETARDKKLPFFKMVDEEGHPLGALPQVRVGQKEFAGDKRSYHAIGQLLAFAYRYSLLTGVHFHSGLFTALSALSPDDMEALYNIDINTWKDLPESVLCKIFAGMNPTYSCLTKSEGEMNEIEKAFYHAFMDTYDEEAPKFKTLREAIENHADGHKEIPYTEIVPAIAITAKGMYSILKGEQWEELNQLGTEGISEKIQGVQLISPELVLSQLRWMVSVEHGIPVKIHENDLTEEQTKTKDFLEQWLRNTNPDDIKRFVKTVTGSTSLTKDTELRMNLYTPIKKGKLPVSHTCFNTLDLPTTYTSREMFDDKMKLFLDYALAGSGFSLT